jgi:hypothetical protein
LLLLVEYLLTPGKFVFSLSHESLLRHRHVAAAYFTAIVDDMLALELYKLDKSRVRTRLGIGLIHSHQNSRDYFLEVSFAVCR